MGSSSRGMIFGLLSRPIVPIQLQNASDVSLVAQLKEEVEKASGYSLSTLQLASTYIIKN